MYVTINKIYMVHLDLFSGIGGFAYAVDQVFENVEHIFCEIDPFCQQVLLKHWPNSKIYGDIRELANGLGTGIIDLDLCQNSVLTVSKNQKPTIQTGVENASQKQPEIGSTVVPNDTKSTNKESENTQPNSGEPLLKPMVASATVVEKQSHHSLPSTILTGKGQENEKELWDSNSIDKLEIADSQKNIKYSATTVTTENIDLANARTKYEIDILTAGIPCQPASQAGKRRGTSDDRWLWPQTFRVIRETQPRFVILENVRGILTLESGLVFKSLLTELENCGYEARAYIIPAVAVNAPHRRDRIWFIANRKIDRLQRGKKVRNIEDEGSPTKQQSTRQTEEWSKNWIEVATELCGVFNGLSRELDEDRQRMNDGVYSKYASTFNRLTRQDLPCLWQGFQSETFQWNIGRFNTIQNKDYLFTILWQYSFNSKRQDNLSFESAKVQDAFMRNVWRNGETGCPPQGWRYSEQYAREHKDALSQLSYEVALATEEVWKDYNEHRIQRLKSLGNAIVPQVALEVLKGIRSTY